MLAQKTAIAFACILGLVVGGGAGAQTLESNSPAEDRNLSESDSLTSDSQPIDNESVLPLRDDSEDVRTSYGNSQTLLKPGDRFELTIVGFPELSGAHTVLANGTVQVPMAGEIRVWGLNPNQVVDRVSYLLLPYVKRPQVGITILNIRPSRISVTGQVRRPGPHRLVAPDLPGEDAEVGDAEGFQTLSYALALAGGITPDADLRKIIIRRIQPGEIGRGLNGELPRREIQVNVWEAIRSGDLSADLRIYDGDEIIVPKTTLSASEQQAMLDSTVAPVTIEVQVGGEVRRPGTVQVEPDDGINAAIAAAGGPTDAATRSVYLLRVDEDGQLERQEYTFGEDDSGPLRDGDVVVVDRSATRTVLDFVGRILAPLAIFNNIVD